MENKDISFLQNTGLTFKKEEVESRSRVIYGNES